jgi:threonine/homoserine/homoserine lactone efflux protein
VSTALSMAAFALATSITPGPVNIVALGAGARYGLRASLRHVTGATVGFALLLLLIGLGLRELLAQWPSFTRGIEWAGVAFLLYVAYKLAVDDGRIDPPTSGPGSARGPSLMTGAAMQWLNPKAWLASIAGMGAYAASGEKALVWQFAAIYFVVCYASIACWAWAGASLRQALREPARVRFVNRTMALLLAASALWLLLG